MVYRLSSLEGNTHREAGTVVTVVPAGDLEAFTFDAGGVEDEGEVLLARVHVDLDSGDDVVKRGDGLDVIPALAAPAATLVRNHR